MNILDQIFAYKRATQAELIKGRPLATLIREIASASAPRGFRATLESSVHRPSLIAEVKKASPIAGELRSDFDPEIIAGALIEGGADCLSVLTDEKYFLGSEGYFRAVRSMTNLPMIRKDFTVSVYDIYSARAMGADAVLLIVNGLSDGELSEFQAAAWELDMDALVEVHNERELERAIAIKANLIGVNNRDLETFETRIETSQNLIPMIPKGVVAVSESALHSREDVIRVRDAGARAVLIGSAFSMSPDVADGVRRVMPW